MTTPDPAPLTFGSLFSGIGGFDLGMERAGLQAIWQCENNKDCQRVLKRHWPNTRLYNDVKEINRTNTATPDVIVGGFPCQDLSIAGKREGLAGERSGLWFEFHRIIAELKPRWAIIENVPGLLSSNSGEDFAVILRGLAECGYYAAWRVLDAQYFGLAQRRRRVFIVASLDGSCAEILFESESGAWDSPPGREAGQRVAATITKRFGGASNQRPPINESDNLIAFSESGPGWWRDGIGTLRERDYKDGNTGLICNTFNGYTGGADDNDAQGNHLVVDIAATSQSGGNGNRPSSRGENIIAFAWQQGVSENDRSFPVRAGEYSGSISSTRVDAVAGNFGVRRLTPVECERLQGFPDGFTEGQNDSQRYRQLGNAVAVPCAEWIGRRIVAINQPLVRGNK